MSPLTSNVGKHRQELTTGLSDRYYLVTVNRKCRQRIAIRMTKKKLEALRKLASSVYKKDESPAFSRDIGTPV